MICDWVGLQGVSFKMICNCFLLLCVVLDEVVDDELILFNLFDWVKLDKLVFIEKCISDFEVDFYMVDELCQVLLNLKKLVECFVFQFWVFIGLCIGELVGLCWLCVDFEVGMIYIQEMIIECIDKVCFKMKLGVCMILLLFVVLEVLSGMKVLIQLVGDCVFMNVCVQVEDGVWVDDMLVCLWKCVYKGMKVRYCNFY